ncbi:Phospholipase_D-nuclease N-terminal [Flavobacterium sp. CF108]|uniref:PLDc N-terminal domain-containing protein n=1 Tax=unclassified Flavobacterium TaxID=196869 RepID=UPI0008B7F040|nr:MULTISPECIES: PLDc N-terminal domain-containing protein [unclassified Flavobacterium]SEN62131.1 Phospholipase_D-nuclease N-terminal [Flavobacterium sp. fv08]SHH04314.1 Phospholipase_D-nuclease N-terminal [Flavobacterium sp. CF108]
MDYLTTYWQIFILLLIVFIIYTLYKLGKSGLSADKKLIWCVLILIFPLIGSIAYMLTGQK